MTKRLDEPDNWLDEIDFSEDDYGTADKIASFLGMPPINNQRPDEIRLTKKIMLVGQHQFKNPQPA